MIIALVIFVGAGGAYAALRKNVAVPSKQFDLICRYRVHEYGRFTGAYLGGGPPPKYDATRYVVDLNSMKYCDVTSCRNKLISDIHAFRGGVIYFYSESYLTMNVRLSDGRYRYWHSDQGLVTYDRGHCRKLRFTTFNTTAPPPR